MFSRFPSHLHLLCAGKRQHIRTLVETFARSVAKKVEPAPATASADALLHWIAGEKPKQKELEHVDIGAHLKTHGLASHLPVEVWPPTAAVRELATWIKSRKRCGHPDTTFVYVNLKKCASRFVRIFFLLHFAVAQVPPKHLLRSRFCPAWRCG